MGIEKAADASSSCTDVDEDTDTTGIGQAEVVDNAESVRSAIFLLVQFRLDTRVLMLSVFDAAKGRLKLKMKDKER